MAHRTSASALHAARTVLQNYDLTVRPREEVPVGYIAKLRNDEAALAVIIDYVTRVFEVAVMRTKLNYWQQRLKTSQPDANLATQIVHFLHELLEAFSKVPKYSPAENSFLMTMQSPAEFKSQPVSMPISKAAIEASRAVYQFYRVSPKRGVTDRTLNQAHIASLIEGSLGLSRAVQSVPVLQHCLDEMRKGDATVSDVKKALRIAGVLMEYLPNYEEREEELKLL